MESTESHHETTEGSKDAVARYQRLLKMARQTLEEQQKASQAKDSQIEQLREELREIKIQEAHTQSYSSTHTIRRIVRRVDAYDKVWVLCEHDEDEEVSWRGFKSVDLLMSYCAREGAAHVQVPAPSLSPDESRAILAVAETKVARITEEFRRYKVRAEIKLKQKQAEAKHTHTHALKSALASSQTFADSDNDDLVRTLQRQLREQENHWRQAYDKLRTETEELRAGGADTSLAKQWRERYEHVARERDQLQERLNYQTSNGSEISGQRNSRASNPELEAEPLAAFSNDVSHVTDLSTFRTRYSELLSQFSQYRLEMHEKLRARNAVIEDLREDVQRLTNGQRGGRGGLYESRHEYLRNLLLKYLTCDNDDVRDHMERALCNIFRFSADDVKKIQERKATSSTVNGWSRMVGLG